MNMDRKTFLRLMSATAASAAFGNRVFAQAPSGGTGDSSSSSGPVLIRGADLLTMDPELGEIERGDVLIENGRIAAVGDGLTRDGAEVIDANGMILMPGMTDGHRHVWQIIDSGRLSKTSPSLYADYQAWKMRTIVSLSPEDHYLAGLVGGLIAIDSGVTSIIDFAHGQIDADTALSAARGIKDSGISGWFAFQLGVSPTFGPGATLPRDEAIAQRITTTTETHWAIAERLQKEVFSDSGALMQLSLSPASGNGSPIAEIETEWARVRGMGIDMVAAHLHKTAQPMPEGYMGHRDSGIPDLHDAGLLGPDYHATHANRLTAEELAMLRDSGGMLCATAMGEFPYVGMGAHRGPSMHARARAAGVAVGIGMDVSLVLTHDYFEHVRSAFWSHYMEPAGTEIARDYHADDVLDFATALGAKSILLGDVTGSITAGKRADLVLLKTDRIGFPMQGTLADRVVNHAAREDIDSVWISGQARKRNGAMIGVDWSDLKSQIAAAQARFSPLADSITFT
jgi:cytosine/adenosine deaminase-related metal-dependent hydrolase